MRAAKRLILYVLLGIVFGMMAVVAYNYDMTIPAIIFGLASVMEIVAAIASFAEAMTS